MRKFLMVAAVGALLLSMAAPALAIDFTFKGEYRVRFYDYSNVYFDKDNATTAVFNVNNVPTNVSVNGRGNIRGVNWRARPRFVVSDDNGNIQAVLRLEIGNTQFGGGGGDNTVGEGNMVGTGNAAVNVSSNRVGAGGGGAIGSDGMGVKTKWMYLDFAAPFGVPLRVRAGTQAIYLPKGMIVDDDAAGVTLYGEVKPVKYSAQWFRIAKATSTNFATVSANSGAALNPGIVDGKDNNYDVFIGKVDVAIAPFLNPGVYFMYGDNREHCSTSASGGATNYRGIYNEPIICNKRVEPSYYFGITDTGKIGIVDYDIDWVYGKAKGGPTGDFGQNSRGVYPSNNPAPFNTLGGLGGPDPAHAINVQGWALDGGVHVPIGPITLNLVGSYASGDKQTPGQTKSKAFPWGIAPSWSGPSQTYSVMAPWELVGEGGGIGGQEDVFNMNHGLTGIWSLGGYVTYNPVKALTLKAGYLHAAFTSKTANCAYIASGSTSCFGPLFLGKPSDPIAGHSKLGEEIDLQSIYQVWTGFSIRASAAWLIPPAGDTAAKYLMYFWYEF